ncbi:MAG: Clp protease N-terminal domain-containing protein, partial [Candidatus Oleimicrobiaceae bacterium]
MRNNFSQRVQRVIQLARDEARRLGHDHIGSEHLLLGLIREGEGLAVTILQRLGCDLDEIRGAIEDAVGVTGETTTYGNIPFTRRAEKVLKMAYNEAERYRSDIIGTEHLLLALVKEREDIASQVLHTFDVSYEAVAQELESIMQGEMSSDKELSSSRGSKTPALDHFGRDLTELARRGELDPIIGRDEEIQRVAQVLSRRKKNNPVLIGEPGVGKTAIA